MSNRQYTHLIETAFIFHSCIYTTNIQILTYRYSEGHQPISLACEKFLNSFIFLNSHIIFFIVRLSVNDPSTIFLLY